MIDQIQMERPKIFISHAWEDKALGRRLEAALRSANAEVWIDHRGIRGGDNLPKRISDALEWCNTLLLIWSDAASRSQWVEMEWTNAISLEKEIIPCRLDKTRLPGILASKAYIDFGNIEQGLVQLLSALKLTRQSLMKAPMSSCDEFEGILQLEKEIGIELEKFGSEIYGDQIVIEDNASYHMDEDENVIGLYLSDLKLRKFPKSILQFKNLTILDLNNNLLATLPSEIIQLKELKELHVSNNPLKHPPPEIVNQGIDAVFEYLRQYPDKEVNEAKLIIVGQGDVGKTCLAKRLIYDSFKHEKSTDGVDIFNWDITAPTNKQEKIKLNVWDFGGQEIYHATHQFFLTKRSIYLLVWNARKSRDYEHIYYWLHTIEAFGGDSPIILVMSKLNERDDDLNMKDLKEKFSQIVGLFKVDSEAGKGIPELKEIIQHTAWNLPQMRTKWVEAWLNVRERLEKHSRDWIEYKEFQDICSSEGLENRQTEILDEYLHDLGVIIHFRDRLELENMVILKPEWATMAVYMIVDTRSIRDRGGILLNEELDQIWDTSIYPREVYPKLLELMNRFELSYELPDKKSQLVAELLPSTEPQFNWDDTDNLRFYYQYDFLPAGVMTRFIVRMHRELEKQSNGKDLCWREGAVLQWEGTRALVKIKPAEKLIEIKIKGNEQRELLAIIRNHFQHINSSINKVKITEQIPCNCSENCTNVFDYKSLINGEKAGREEIDCQKTWSRVSLRMLLDGYRKRDQRTNESTTHAEAKTDFLVAISSLQDDFFKLMQALKQRQSKLDKEEFKMQALQQRQAKLDKEEFKKNLENELKELKELNDNLMELNPNFDDRKEVNVGVFNKLRNILREIDDSNSTLSMAVRSTKNAIPIVQIIVKSYNKIAQLLALPQVPDPFLAQKTNE